MNSKILILFVVVVVVGLATVNAGPVYLEEELHESNYPEEEKLPGPRQKRVTCDLLSASFKGSSINDSACAAHCLIQRFKGGHCNNGVCHCRR